MIVKGVGGPAFMIDSKEEALVLVTALNEALDNQYGPESQFLFDYLTEARTELLRVVHR